MNGVSKIDLSAVYLFGDFLAGFIALAFARRAWSPAGWIVRRTFFASLFTVRFTVLRFAKLSTQHQLTFVDWCSATNILTNAAAFRHHFARE